MYPVQYRATPANSILYTAINKLSRREVSTAKPKAADYRLTDGGHLYLLVKKNGTKSWRLDYKHHDKRKTLALGILDDVSLSRAREKAKAARALLVRPE